MGKEEHYMYMGKWRIVILFIGVTVMAIAGLVYFSPKIKLRTKLMAAHISSLLTYAAQEQIETYSMSLRIRINFIPQQHRHI